MSNALVTDGFHHVTMVSSNAQQTVNFYRDVLGFPLIKQTVNFDIPDTYHLYFGKHGGAPGTLLTFFEWPQSRRGRYGVGGIHHVALGTHSEDTQLMWKRWLAQHGVNVTGPYDRGYFTSIYFTDPDGQILEIATEGPGFAVDEPAGALGATLKEPPPWRLPGGRDENAIRARTWPGEIPDISQEMELSGIHHVTGMTDDLDASNVLYHDGLGLSLVKQSLNQDDPDTLHYFWANYDGQSIKPASDMTLFGWRKGAPAAREGTGQTHHVAYRAIDFEQLLEWQEHLRQRGLEVTDVRDRKYFQSIYFRSHDGLLLEIATDGPGFAIDEPSESLGSTLQLPAQHESNRELIAANLTPLR